MKLSFSAILLALSPMIVASTKSARAATVVVISAVVHMLLIWSCFSTSQEVWIPHNRRPPQTLS